MAAQSYDRLEGVIWYDGRLVPWDEAKLHVLSMACITRAACSRASAPMAAASSRAPSIPSG